MSHTLKIPFHLLLLTVSIAAQSEVPPSGFIPTVECQISELDKCTIKDFHLNPDQIRFNPIAVGEGTVRNITILKSTIPVLDESICKAFPNLIQIIAIEVGIEEIRADAFTHCKDLSYLDLSMNNVKMLTSETFAENAKLETLLMYGNQLVQLDKNLFQGTPKLKTLYLRHNRIKVLDVDLFQNINELHHLNLYHNQLVDLEIEKILEHTPKLQTINLRYNYFKCDRLKVILDVLKRKSVFNNDGEYTPKDLTYKPELIDGTECDNGDKPIERKENPTKKPKKDKDEKKRNAATSTVVSLTLMIVSAVLGRAI